MRIIIRFTKFDKNFYMDGSETKVVTKNGQPGNDLFNIFRTEQDSTPEVILPSFGLSVQIYFVSHSFTTLNWLRFGNKTTAELDL